MFPRKQTLKQRLLQRMFTKKSSWSQHLCKAENENRTEQREKLSRSLVPTEASANPMRSSGAAKRFQSFPFLC